MRRVAAHTLGCKLNFAETSHLLRQLNEIGYMTVGFDEIADLYIINTCTVTAIAEKKCRAAIRQAVRRNANAQVAVIGCFAQREAESISQMEGVTIVLGNDRKHLLPQLVAQHSEFEIQNSKFEIQNSTFPLAYSVGDRTRSFLKIQDGCDYYCTYCAIPFARGHSRSATVSQVLDAAHDIEQHGIREVVLTGVNTGTFGLHNGETLLQLLQALDNETGIARFRISSIEPNLITDDIIRFVSQSRAFLPHFHIPLQAGSDKILRLMHRRYDTALFLEKIQLIRNLMPHACIAADIMAGFNGEDEETFAEVCRYVESLPLSYLHVFTYSDRPGTAALKLVEKIDMARRREHSEVLRQISDSKRHAFCQSHIGSQRPVLWESTRYDGNLMQGWTDNYIRLQRPYSPDAANSISVATLSNDNIVWGETDD